MNYILFQISFLVVTISSFSQVLSAPESVEWDQANNRWLVGNSGNGTILTRTNAGVLSAFVSGMPNGPHGIEILGDKVFACSGGFIRGYNLSNGVNVFNLNVGGSFLNGLTSDGVNFLYATDFTAKKIFKIDVNATSFTTIASGLARTPNGILCEPENNRCLIVNWGTNAPILAIDLTTFAVTTILNTTLGNCDGITKDSCGNYYITAWSNNKLNKFNPTLTGTFTVVPGTLSSPADIDTKFGSISDVIGIPNSGAIAFPEIARQTIIISQTGSNLSTAGVYQNYQWFLDNVIIDGANQQTLIPTSIGNYFCVVFDGYCELTSNIVTVSNLATNDFNQIKTKAYPNPSKDFITIETNSETPITYSILDVLGKKVFQSQEIKKSVNENFQINLRNLSKGFYYIKIDQNENSEIIKILKE